MDFPVAAPIKAALTAAVSRDDVGYPPLRARHLVESFVDFAARRLHWRVDPDHVQLVPDVMIGVLALARLLAGPDRSMAVVTPAYRRSWSIHRPWDCQYVRCRQVRTARSTWTP
jgi:cystathionine beta-lyase